MRLTSFGARHGVPRLAGHTHTQHSMHLGECGLRGLAARRMGRAACLEGELLRLRPPTSSARSGLQQQDMGRLACGLMDVMGLACVLMDVMGLPCGLMDVMGLTCGLMDVMGLACGLMDVMGSEVQMYL